MHGTTLSYSVAWTPAPQSELARFGAAWFGWCAERGERHEEPVFDNLSRPFEAITRSANLGCLQAPLGARIERPINDGVSFAMESHVARMAERLAPLPIAGFEVIRRASGLALAPVLPSLAIARVLREAAGMFGEGANRGEFAIPLTGPVNDLEAEILSARVTCLLRPEHRLGHMLSELTLIAYPGFGGRPVAVQRFGLGVVATEAEAMTCTGPDELLPEPVTLPFPELRARSIA